MVENHGEWRFKLFESDEQQNGVWGEAKVCR